MLKESNRFIRHAMTATDLGVTVLSFYVAYILRNQVGDVQLKPFSEHFFLLYLIVPVWLFLLFYFKCYQSIRIKSLRHILTPTLKTVLAGGFMIMSFFFAFKIMHISRALILMFLVIDLALLVSIRVCLYLFVHYVRTKGYNYRSLLIVGSGRRAEAFASILDKHKEWGMKVLGFVDYEESASKRVYNSRLIGSFSQLPEILTSNQIDEVIFVVPRSGLDRIEKQILLCEEIGIKASITADFYSHKLAKGSFEELQGWPLLAYTPYPRIEEWFVLKRAFDVAFASAVLLLSAPFFIAITLAVTLGSPGPVFFRQTRCGMNGRQFDLLKFRTMVMNADKLKSSIEHLNEMSGPVFKAKNDPRITGVGRFLRKYSLDELPQLLNVLKGDMSLVGPRPPLPEEVARYDMWQRRRLSVRPGLTCIWQVSGRNNIGFEQWMRLDLEYIDNWSFSQDFKIILKTIPTVLRGTGV
ncbi:MAG: sugar transferase [Deltaproteobacteria bacterium]|nr:sugar transferase [Deltaproteobacteria bacterium]